MEDKRQQILDVARARFDRFGVKKTTMDEIAKDAGISKKTIYELFKNKEDLFVSVFIREAIGNMHLIVEKVTQIQDPLEKLRQLVVAAVHHHRHATFMTKVLKDENGLYAPHLKDKYRLQVEENILGLCSDILNAGIKAGRIRPLDVRTVSYFMLKLFQGVTFARTATLKEDDNGIDELVKFILEGIVNKQGTEK